MVDKISDQNNPSSNNHWYTDWIINQTQHVKLLEFSTDVKEIEKYKKKHQEVGHSNSK